MSVHLLNSKVLEKNDISLIVSLYLNKNKNGEIYFSYYSDYFGFGINKNDDIYKRNHHKQNGTRNILSNDIQITKPEVIDEDECQMKVKMFIENMNNLTFEDALCILQKGLL